MSKQAAAVEVFDTANEYARALGSQLAKCHAMLSLNCADHLLLQMMFDLQRQSGEVELRLAQIKDSMKARPFPEGGQ